VQEVTKAPLGKLNGTLMLPVYSGADVVLPSWWYIMAMQGRKGFLFAAKVNDVLFLV